MRDITKWDPRRDPWLVDADDFPAAGVFADQAEFLLRAAVLAPSGHNTQPWRFTVREPDVLVSADPERRLAALAFSMTRRWAARPSRPRRVRWR